MVGNKMLGIGSKEIHIWTGSYQSSEELFERMVSVVSPSEIQRANAFHFNRDRQNYVQSHCLLRLLLSLYTGVCAQKIDFEFGAYGKPFLKDASTIRFNMSHTKEMIAVAVTSDSDVGIDIEKPGHLDGVENLARQFMSDTELREMSCLEPGLRNSYLYRCWVNKEALVKASGRGIDDDLRLVTVMDEPCENGARILSSGYEGKRRRWRLDTFDPAPDHIGAVCVELSLGVMDDSIKFTTRNLLNLFEASPYGMC